MKKSIILFLFSSLLLSAQQNGGSIGVKGGLNLSTITGKNDFDFAAKLAYHLGFMFESTVSESVSLQPEILFSSQGANEQSSYEDLEFRLNYVNVPILIKYYVSEGFSIDGGAQLGVLVAAKQSYHSSKDIDIKTNFSDTDYGLLIGTSYKFINKINLSARYNFGLKDISNSNYSFFNNGNIKNGVFQLSLGYYFNNKK